MFIGLDAVSLRLRAAEPPPGDDGASLTGQLFVVKDSVNVGGMPTTGGTTAFADTVVATDAPVIARLRDAGAIVAAKANMHELSFGVTSNNAVYGAVGNPHDPSMIAGGSSGGSAAAVATEIVSFAIAADTGGSARVPAALCGVVGFRPTVGRYSIQGVLPLSPTRDTVGVIADSVRRVHDVDAVIKDPAFVGSSVRGRERIRLGVPMGLDDTMLDHAVAQSYHSTLHALGSSGIEVVPIDLAGLFGFSERIGQTISLAEFPGAVQRFVAEMEFEVSAEAIQAGIGSPDVRRLWTTAFHSPVPAAEYQRALNQRRQARQRFLGIFDRAGLDAIVFPTTPITARPIGDDETVDLRGHRVETFATLTRYSHLAGVLGLPGISLPSDVDDGGLPIGIELNARPGDDDRLLEVAAAIAPHLAGVPSTTPPHLPRTTHNKGVL